MPSKTDAIPKVPKEVLRRVTPSDNPFVTDVNEMIGLLSDLFTKLPRRYGWRYRTAEAFRVELAGIAAASTDALPVNLFYWRDQIGNWEAYSYMNTVRVVDLARSCIWALARQDTVCASLLARSALETAASFVDSARTVNASICGSSTQQQPSPVLDPAIDLRKTMVISEELENYSMKTIFASRLPESETIYNPTNIVTIITRISKVRAQEFILPTYGILCEAAHPNMLGRALYIHGSEPGPWTGNELRILGPGNGPAWTFLAEHIVAALSWACATQVTSFQLMSETIASVAIRLKALDTKVRDSL
jgi:hypothetical protein